MSGPPTCTAGSAVVCGHYKSVANVKVKVPRHDPFSLQALFEGKRGARLTGREPRMTVGSPFLQSPFQQCRHPVRGGWSRLCSCVM